jgi:predicted TIM-barrel fold metal-dependent hydrolase
MTMPTDVPIIDTMIGFPHDDFSTYDFIRAQTKDAESNEEFDFPVEYMFKNVPKELYGANADPIDVTLGEMDRHGIQYGMIGAEGELYEAALKRHPDRFIGTANADPNDVMGEVRKIKRLKEELNIRAVGAFPSGCNPQVNIDDPKFYPIYATCCELDLPIFVCAGVPGPRLPMDPQRVERIDRVMYDFPELTFVTRHGCEPWEALAVKLMLKWPGLHYSTSAFAPKHYPQAIIDYANSRGADKIVYAGYFPMGLSLDRIMGDMKSVPFKDHVWPKFLNENAKRILKLD